MGGGVWHVGDGAVGEARVDAADGEGAWLGFELG